MPFTVAHVAAILPFVGRGGWRRHLDPTALVLGSMAPDFDYFLHGRMQGGVAHTLPGLLLFDLPMTIVLWLSWRFICLEPVLFSLPQVLTVRMNWDRSRAACLHAIVLGAVVGSASHLLWDGFTHASTPIVAAIPVLRTVVDLPGLGPMAAYRGLQHGSTLVGLGLIAHWAFVRWPHADRGDLPRSSLTPLRMLLPSTCLMGGAMGLGLGIWKYGLGTGEIGNVVVLIIDGWLLGLLLGAIVVAVCRRLRRF